MHMDKSLVYLISMAYKNREKGIENFVEDTKDFWEALSSTLNNE